MCIVVKVAPKWMAPAGCMAGLWVVQKKVFERFWVVWGIQNRSKIGPGRGSGEGLGESWGVLGRAWGHLGPKRPQGTKKERERGPIGPPL